MAKSDQQKKRVLVAETMDSSPSISACLDHGTYEVKTVKDGYDCIDCLKSFSPDLLLLDLALPNFQSMDVLRVIHATSESISAGIIVATDDPCSKERHEAEAHGACYVLPKPIDSAVLSDVVSRYFTSELRPEEMLEQLQSCAINQDYYQPQVDPLTTYAKFWGTRGSVPVAGLDYYRYGGNTACLELSDGKHCAIIDAGTGIRPLGQKVMESGITDIHLFLGHTHWDHIIGFPFFAPVYDPRFHIHIYAPRGFTKDTESLFQGMLEEEFFPIRLEDMRASFTFNELSDQLPVKVGELTIHSHYARHPGATHCFKIATPRKTIGYATDNEFLAGYHGHPGDIHMEHPLVQPYRSFIDFYRGCDTLIHEAQYTPEQYRERVGWGHSSVSNVAALAHLTGAREWVATHHDPNDTDEVLLQKVGLHRQVIRDAGAEHCHVLLAYDGMTLPI